MLLLTSQGGLSTPHTLLFTCPGGSQNSIGEPPTEPTIAPTGTGAASVAARRSYMFFAVYLRKAEVSKEESKEASKEASKESKESTYQQMAENPCTVPFGPGSASFHIGAAVQLQVSPHAGRLQVAAERHVRSLQLVLFHSGVPSGRSGRGNGGCWLASMILPV